MTRFECVRCEKSFSCGKGLGGHKRVHRSSKRERGHGGDGDDDQTSMALVPVPSGENSCPVCRQSFWSEKSLHGHMRKHPDRNWRGMVPPPNDPAPPVDADSLAVANNLLALANNPFNRFACDLCGRQFKSYQALGGHKSHHGLKAPRPVYMVQPEGFGFVGQPSGEGGNGWRAGLLNLDLNELPPEEL